jgi:uncharacterized protein YbjT (DUF2867 family)
MKALVTGGTGFIGRKVVGLLAEHGHTVRLLVRKDNLPSHLAGKGVSLFRGDLQNADSVINAMAGMDTFYHNR